MEKATESAHDPAQEPVGEAQWSHTMELVRRFKTGDAPALDEIFERYYERVVRIVRIELRTGKYAWLCQRVDTDDIVQNTFIKALEIFDRFDMQEPAGLVRWLVKIAKNKLRDEADRHGAERRDMAREISMQRPFDSSRSSFDLAGTGLLPGDLVQRQEESEVVDKCVAELQDDWREVIIRREYEGGSWNYVAAAMKRTEGATQMLHQRARARLSELVIQRLQT